MKKLENTLKFCNSSGFSLMELAVVMMIIGTLMSGVLVAVGESTANARITNARAQLRNLEEALYGFAQANGRLPCPATDTSNGLESPVGGGTSCTERHGFVPVATLGLYGSINSDGLLLDPWQNPVRYSVADYAYSTDWSFTTSTGLEELYTTDPTDFVGQSSMLRVCGDSTCIGPVYADSAPAVLLSMGANWNDYTSVNEQKNAGDGSSLLGTYNIKSDADNDFVSDTYSEENFDDQIIWLSPYVLFNKLISAGKLP